MKVINMGNSSAMIEMEALEIKNDIPGKIVNSTAHHTTRVFGNCCVMLGFMKIYQMKISSTLSIRKETKNVC